MIETKHIVWIFTEAGEHFEKEIERIEMEIMRHKAFLHEPMVCISLVKKTRQDRLSECEEYLKQYREIVNFCRLAREQAAEKSAEEFARQFKGAFSFTAKPKA
jgi:hypothetical protein